MTVSAEQYVLLLIFFFMTMLISNLTPHLRGKSFMFQQDFRTQPYPNDKTTNYSNQNSLTIPKKSIFNKPFIPPNNGQQPPKPSNLFFLSLNFVFFKRTICPSNDPITLYQYSCRFRNKQQQQRSKQ